MATTRSKAPKVPAPADNTCALHALWTEVVGFMVRWKEHGHDVAASFEMTMPQVLLLKELSPDEARPMSRLAMSLACDASNVTGLVDRLEARGLIARREAAHDRRVKEIVLTEAGVAHRNAVMAKLFEPPPALAHVAEADLLKVRDLLSQARW